MKKIITLLVCATVFSQAVVAQTNEDARRVILGGSKRGNSDRQGNDPRDVVLGGENRRVYEENGSRSSRRAEVDATNREYDRRIRSVRNNPFLGAAEKDRRINELERERRQRIREINNAYGGRRNNDRNWERRNNRRLERDDDDDDDDDRRYERRNRQYKDNGKRWERNRNDRRGDDDDDD